MNNPAEIPTNFTIPKRLWKRRWLLKCKNGAFEITVAGRRKIRFFSSGKTEGVETSLTLDWIAFTVEELRWESEH